MAHAITKDNLQQALEGGKPVVIDFWAEWCGPCRTIGPAIEELAAEYEGKALVAKCDIEENNEIAVKFGIRNIPTILFFKDGQLVDKQVGASPKHMIEEKIKNLL